ncbi:hypothetical protein IVB40_28655 [Bradyrhizobium sp. 40]|uniref:hypothetical protein n=1 Tax=Bradyrhizobium sp. 40 TaxID=2782674 RepID=UPI001FFEEA67|nr:hypothetical protein [Bradyrhizobium sp. 40]UPJ41218.1 hypothetical protein IVB40_28655 [Bradyrhizobium sp. 40]
MLLRLFVSVGCATGLALATVQIGRATPAGHAGARDLDQVKPFKTSFNGEPPSDIVSIAPKLVAVFDHASGSVMFLDDAGASQGIAKIPEGFRVEIVRQFPDRTVLIDKGGAGKIVLPRGTVAPSALPEIAKTQVVVNDPDLAPPELINRNFRRKGLKPQNGAGFDGELEIFSLTPDITTSATFLGVDGQGFAYSLSRELQIAEVRDGDRGGLGKKAVIRVTLVVGKHDKDGRRIAATTLPLDEFFKTPFGRYVTVDTDGSVLAVLPLAAKGSRSKGVYVYRPVLAAETTQHRTRAPLAAGQQTINAIRAVSDRALISAPLGDTANGEPPGLLDAPAKFEAGGRSVRPVAEMKDAASKIMNFPWSVKAGNLVAGQQVNCTFGAKDEAHAFELPHHLKRAKVGEQMTGVPYNWDGKSDLGKIKTELENGFAAGNICSEIEDKTPHTTGLDCSGFIAQVWGVGAFGTSNAYKITRPLKTLEALQWGDALNLPSHHIRLFVRQDVGSEHGLRLQTLESQGACGGTCERRYHAEHFHGFELVRLNGVK